MLEGSDGRRPITVEIVDSHHAPVSVFMQRRQGQDLGRKGLSVAQPTFAFGRLRCGSQRFATCAGTLRTSGIEPLLEERPVGAVATVKQFGLGFGSGPVDADVFCQLEQFAADDEIATGAPVELEEPLAQRVPRQIRLRLGPEHVDQMSARGGAFERQIGQHCRIASC